MKKQHQRSKQPGESSAKPDAEPAGGVPRTLAEFEQSGPMQQVQKAKQAGKAELP